MINLENVEQESTDDVSETFRSFIQTTMAVWQTMVRTGRKVEHTFHSQSTVQGELNYFHQNKQSINLFFIQSFSS